MKREPTPPTRIGIGDTVYINGYSPGGFIQILAEHVLLPTQVASRIDTATPEKRLMAAVLEDALRILAGARTHPHMKSTVLIREVVEWIASNDTRRPFAFVCLCEHLGLEVECLRKALAVEGFKLADPMRRQSHRGGFRTQIGLRTR